MIYMAMGYLHAAIERRLRRIQTLLASESGQGTVEYVGLILLVSLLMVGMVAAMKGFNRLRRGYTTQADGRNLSPPAGWLHVMRLTSDFFGSSGSGRPSRPRDTLPTLFVDGRDHPADQRRPPTLGRPMPSPLPGEDQLAAEYRWVLGLLATDPPAYQAGPLTTARDRIAQARRMLIPQAVNN